MGLIAFFEPDAFGFVVLDFFFVLAFFVDALFVRPLTAVFLFFVLDPVVRFAIVLSSLIRNETCTTLEHVVDMVQSVCRRLRRSDHLARQDNTYTRTQENFE